MDATNESSPVTQDTASPNLGSKDGDTAADNDQPYRFGRRPNARAPWPFTERQYARLLILRSRLDADQSLEDRAAA
jgi:uncharacterized Fe-S cluster-containing radical SAM superfamily enzyme